MEVIDTEIEILGEMLGRKKPKARKDLKRIIREKTRMPKDEDYKALAAEMRRDQRVAKLAWRQGQKEARAAEREKGLKKTSRQVGRIRNQYIAKILKLKEAQRERIGKMREIKRIQKEKEGIHRRMARLIRHKSMIPEYKAQVVDILGRYYNIPNAWKTDPPEMDLRAFLEEKEITGESVDTAVMLLEGLPAKSKGKLSIDEIRAVNDVVTAIAHMERLERNQNLVNEKMSLEAMVDEIVTRVHQVHRSKPQLHPVEAGRRLTRLKRIAENAERYNAATLKPEFILDALDGWQDVLGGPNWEYIFAPMKAAEDAELVIGEQIITQLREAFAGFDSGWSGKKYRIPGVDPMMTKEEMIMVALNAGNDGNRNALVNGNAIPEEAIDYILDKLDAREQALVRRVWKIIDSMFPMLDKVHRQLTGVRLPKVDGMYFPLVFNRKLSWSAGEHAATKELWDMFASEYHRKYVEAGHRVMRKKGEKPAVRLEIDVIHGHITKVIHDITHQIPVRNVQKIIHHPKFRNAVTATLGDSVYRQLAPWLQGIARPRTEPISELEKWAGKIRKNATAVSLGLKVSVALKQQLSLTQTMDEVGVWQTLKAMKQFYSDPFGCVDFVNDRSPSMRNRRKSWDRELYQMYKDFDPTAFRGSEMVKDAFFAMISLNDAMATYPTWMAAYNKGLDVYKLDEDKAIEYADKVVRTTQPAASPKDLAAIQRGGEYQKLFTMFYTFFSVFRNRMFKLHSMYRLGRISTIELFKSYWLILVLPAVLGTAIQKRELEPADMMAGIFNYGFGGFPFIRDFASGAASTFGYSMTPAEGFGDQVGYLAHSIMADETNYRKIAKSGIMATGYLTGLPSSQITVTLDGMLDMAAGKHSNPMYLLVRQNKK